MAKKRQSIRDIQAALRAQTVHFNGEQASEPRQLLGGESGVEIMEESLRKLRLLAGYQQSTPEELLQMALDDFFALRRRQLEAAEQEQAEATQGKTSADGV